MRPLIGIVGRVEYPGDTDKLVVNDIYRRVIVESGGNPFMLLPVQSIDYAKTKGSEIPELTVEEKELLVQQLRSCDGILLPGGFKMLNIDFFVIDYAIKNNIPIFGICLGMQIMASYGKGCLPVKNDPNGINHYDNTGNLVHSVNVDVNSKLYSILRRDSFSVNSFHKFHVPDSSFYHTVCYSEDGLIEGVEYPYNSFNIGVQWHPERMYKDDLLSKRLFDSFIEAAINHSKDINIYVHK